MLIFPMNNPNISGTGIYHEFRLLSQDEAPQGQLENYDVECIMRRQETGNEGGLWHDHYYISHLSLPS